METLQTIETIKFITKTIGSIIGVLIFIKMIYDYDKKKKQPELIEAILVILLLS